MTSIPEDVLEKSVLSIGRIPRLLEEILYQLLDAENFSSRYVRARLELAGIKSERISELEGR